VLWNDLNIHPGEYASQVVVECIKLINTFKESFKFVPTRLQYKETTMESYGYYTWENSTEMSESSEILDSLIKQFQDMESLIKKNFLAQGDV
jgi:hypothetical protein